VSDVIQVQPNDDQEVRQFAQTLWSSDNYRTWRTNALQAVADGTIYSEPPLGGPPHAMEA